jgi:hypothetical protein
MYRLLLYKKSIFGLMTFFYKMAHFICLFLVDIHVKSKFNSIFNVSYLIKYVHQGFTLNCNQL